MINTEITPDAYFRQMKLDYDATQNSYRHILTTMEDALASGDYNTLWELIPYIEEGEGQLAFQYIGKTQRLLRILNILRLEDHYRKPLFCQDCSGADALWEKYMLTLFAFRRILFRLSEESQEEAAVWLRSHPVSHFAAYIMVQGELIIPDQAFYETLAQIYSQTWSGTDMQQFLAMTGLPQST